MMNCHNYDRNMEHLVAEFKKKNCNNIILKKLLKITYEKRHRNLIMSDSINGNIGQNIDFFASTFCVRSHRCPVNTKELHSFL